jgi:hypothetical protein
MWTAATNTNLLLLHMYVYSILLIHCSGSHQTCLRRLWSNPTAMVPWAPACTTCTKILASLVSKECKWTEECLILEVATQVAQRVTFQLWLKVHQATVHRYTTWFQHQYINSSRRRMQSSILRVICQTHPLKSGSDCIFREVRPSGPQM